MRDTVFPVYLANTVQLMVVVAALSTVIGVLTAWLTVHYDFPLRRMLVPALALPLAAPPMLSAMSMPICWNFPARFRLRYEIGCSCRPQVAVLPNMQSLPGAGLVISLVLYPYVYLLARGSFTQQSSTLCDAARALGASRSRVFWRVALPVAWPAVAGGLALVLMETVADYGVVEHYGVPTLTTGIFRTWFAMGETAAATPATCWLVVRRGLPIGCGRTVCTAGQRFNPSLDSVSRRELCCVAGLGGSPSHCVLCRWR